MPEWILKLVKDFEAAFIVDNRWKYLLEGILRFLSAIDQKYRKQKKYSGKRYR